MSAAPALIDATRAALLRAESIPESSVRVLFSPYRICPIGAHIDHQGGPVLGRTINLGTVLAFAPLNKPEIRIHSTNFGEARFPIGAPPDSTWERYARAAAIVVEEQFGPLKRGFVGAIHGAMIGAGLSSSASVGLAYISALADVNGIQPEPGELIQMEYRLEAEILGLKIGILDPATIVHGRADALLYIDTQTGQVTPIPDQTDAAWVVAFSGVTRELTRSGFNNRVAECREAASLLRPGATRLGDVHPENFDQQRLDLPGPLRLRAEHFFNEVERVNQGKKFWAEGNLQIFGGLMKASCASSIHLYESGSPVLIDLQKIVSKTPGVYGSRFSGGGYGGCVIALVERKAAYASTFAIMEHFAARHPELEQAASVQIAEPSDGLRFV